MSFQICSNDFYVETNSFCSEKECNWKMLLCIWKKLVWSVVFYANNLLIHFVNGVIDDNFLYNGAIKPQALTIQRHNVFGKDI